MSVFFAVMYAIDSLLICLHYKFVIVVKGGVAILFFVYCTAQTGRENHLKSLFLKKKQVEKSTIL